MQQRVLTTHSAAPALHRSKRCRSVHGKAVRAAAAAVEAKPSPSAALTSEDEDLDQHRREGAHEAELLQLQVGGRVPAVPLQQPLQTHTQLVTCRGSVR